MVTSLDPNLLLSIYTTRSSLSGANLSSLSSAAKKTAPTTPWSKIPTPEQAAIDSKANIKSALAGHSFINENNVQLDVPGASDDYRKLFALYQGLGTLSDLANQAQKKGLTSIEKDQLQKAFTKGLGEVTDYVKSVQLEKARLTTGDVVSTARTTAPVQAAKSEYVTGTVYAGTSSDPVPAFSGNVAFNIAVKRSGAVHNVAIDLSKMTEPRSVANVVNFINGKLQAEGLDTRFATQRTPGEKKTVTVNGKAVDIGVGPDQWAFKIKPSGESVSFSASASTPAAYVVQTAGNPDPDGKPTTNDAQLRQQFLKFQTDNTGVDAPSQPVNQANWVDGQTFQKTLGPEVKTVRETKVGPDGSVYMLADVVNKTAGQDIKGTQDAALLKYDPAGNLVFSRTLGASDSASGLGLAIAADGKVAVAGSVTGGLNGATNGALNSGPTGTFADQSDSFVTVYNADGEELYTQRRGARLADEASQVTFGADGTVYVAGRAKSALPGSTNIGDFDSYIEAFAPPDAKGKVVTNFTQNFGTSSSDRPAGMVLDGTSLVVASIEGGRGVLRRYDVSGATPTLTASRDLGDLQGGDITGLALDGGDVVIAGYTANRALNAGTVQKANAGGVDAFAARLSASLSPAGSDSIAYYGGTGDDRATGLAVSGGKVWLTGTAGTDLPGQAAVGKKDGFLAQIDVGTGTVAWSRRFTGKDGYGSPAAIAIDPSGSSALDKLGLPKGDIDLTDSQKLTAASSLRAGEQFTVRSGTSRPTTITIDQNETLDTLAQKIRRATGFQAKVTIGSADGKRKLTIAPSNPRNVIEFGAGKTDKNALEMLGIPEGVVRTTTVGDHGSVPADGKGQIYGLTLANDLTLDGSNGAAHAAAEIAGAQTVVRRIYRELVQGATPETPAQKASGKTGTVPTYLTNQIANYQAALDRLGG